MISDETLFALADFRIDSEATDLDTLALKMEYRIEDGERALREAPEFELGQKIRARHVTVQDLLNA